MDYIPKGSGLSYIKRMLTKAFKDNKTKHIALTLDQAKSVMDEIKIDKAEPALTLKSNSLKASALLLCIDPKELLERLSYNNSPNIQEQLKKAKNKIHYLEKIGDEILDDLPLKEQEKYANKWVMAKKLNR